MSENKNNQNQGKVFVISAPSGTGKTTLVKETINRLNNQYDISKVITYTTRNLRTGEINGKDYHFISHDDFLQKEKDGFFLEITKYDNQKYGSPASILTDIQLGKSFIIMQHHQLKM